MVPVRPNPSARSLLDLRPVLSNRAALGYVLGYGAHCFELYGLRTWIVAFWAYVAQRNVGSVAPDPVTVSFIVTVLAMPSSIIGNEAAIRFGRHRTIVAVMCLAALSALLIALNVDAHPSLLLALLIAYSIAIPADSGALTSGMAASADPHY